MILTGNYNEIEKAFSNAISAAFTLAIVIWIIRIVLLIAIVAIITWVVRKVWDATGNRNQKRRIKRWEKAQKRWMKNQKRLEWNTYQKSGIPQNPDFKVINTNEKFENNPDWKWDEETQLWRHRSQWEK